MIDFFNLFLGWLFVIEGFYVVVVSISLREKDEISTLFLIRNFSVGIGMEFMGWLLLSGHMRFIC